MIATPRLHSPPDSHWTSSQLPITNSYSPEQMSLQSDKIPRTWTHWWSQSNMCLGEAPSCIGREVKWPWYWLVAAPGSLVVLVAVRTRPINLLPWERKERNKEMIITEGGENVSNRFGIFDNSFSCLLIECLIDWLIDFVFLDHRGSVLKRRVACFHNGSEMQNLRYRETKLKILEFC